MNPYLEVGDYSPEERKGHGSLLDSVSFLDSEHDEGNDEFFEELKQEMH